MTSAKRPRIAFAALSEEGKLNALRIWQPDYFTGTDMPDYVHLTLEEWQAAVLAHWNNVPASEQGFMDDNSGRM